MLDVGDRHCPRAGFERETGLDGLVGFLQKHALATRGKRLVTDREYMGPLAVHTHFELMRLPGVSGKLDGQSIFAVNREIAPDDHAAARADGRAFLSYVLRKIGWKLVSVDDHRDRWIADGQAAHFPRDRKIAFEDRGRHEQEIGQVVEARARVVGREKRGDVELLRQHVEIEEIADGVLVFRPAEAMKGADSAGIGLGGRGAIELLFEVRRDAVVRGLIRSWRAGGRHGARPQFSDHLLPDNPVVRHVRDVGGVERETCRFQPLVVAGHAVAINNRARFRGRGRHGPTGRGLRLRRRAVKREGRH